MLIDFIEVTGTFSGKGTFNFSNLQFEQYLSDQAGNDCYTLNGCRKLRVFINEATGEFKLAGSIAYYMQGHNFVFSMSHFFDAIEYINGLLNFDLWLTYINILELGVIIEVDKRPKDFIQHHREGKGMTLNNSPKYKGNFASFDDRLANRKMYDAGRNIQHKQGLTMKQVIEAAGWNPEGYYLKWEVHYKKPEYCLNNGHGIRLCDLMNPSWAEAFKTDIYSQYQKIIPMKSIIPPSSKSDLHALDIFAIELAEAKLNEGKSLEEVKKLLYDRINASSVLSKADKDARKRQVKATLDKLLQSEESVWDISRQLEEALFGDSPQDSGQGQQYQ